MRKKVIFFIISLLIIFSFVSHDIIPHSHHHSIYGSGLQAIFHGSDKKWYMLVLLGFLLLLTNLLIRTKKEIESLFKGAVRISSPPVNPQNLHDPMKSALRRGIVNSKFCD